MPSRRLEHLDNRMRPLVERWLARCASELPFGVLVTQTWRDSTEHRAYYAQGREPLESTNGFRKAAGLPPITEAENARKVTWVQFSKHMLWTDGAPASLAVDFCIVDGSRKPVWDPKADVDKDGVPDYEAVGRIAEACGLVWGGRWKTPDYPHVELPT